MNDYPQPERGDPPDPPPGLMQEQVTSSVASRDGWPGRMSSCPSRFPRSSATM